MADNTSEDFWEDPCNLRGQKYKGSYTASLAKDVVDALPRFIEDVEKYQDDFANKTHTFDSFKVLLSHWEADEWFRAIPWVRDVDLLPLEKQYNVPVSDEKLEQLLETDKKIDEILPHMYRGLKLIVASFNAMSKVYKENYYSNLTAKLVQTNHDIRFMLCRFSDLMEARKLMDKVGHLDQSEIPTFQQRERDVLLVFRDSLNYVEYLKQVFGKMFELHSKNESSNAS